MGTLIAAHCDLDALLALAARAPAVSARPWTPPPAPAMQPAPAMHPAPVVAVAGGAAFTFGYAEQAELLEAAGARVARFDPLRDEDLPGGTAGLILGGGFPEMHAAALSANERLRERVAALAARGAPVAAECAGLLYLARALDGRPMCGVLDVRAAMTPKLTLGYRRAVAVTDSVLARAGDVVHGHEFHRTAAAPAAGDQPAWRFGPGTAEGHVAGSVVASYLHTHWAGHPAAAARFAAACAKVPAP
jgi:cobyrinic acid a,c-diamide synthase